MSRGWVAALAVLVVLPAAIFFWFQVYTLRDDDFMKRLFQRAKEAKIETIVITLDLQLQGQRHKDLKNGLSVFTLLLPTAAVAIADA